LRAFSLARLAQKSRFLPAQGLEHSDRHTPGFSSFLGKIAAFYGLFIHHLNYQLSREGLKIAP
jgi:hypothetical protein